MKKKAEKIKKRIGRGRPIKIEDHLEVLRSLGLFSPASAQAAGVPKTSLSRLVKADLIKKVARGLYVHSQVDLDPEIEDFTVACSLFGPLSVIGGLTALYYYNLTDQAPSRIWVLVPPSKWSQNTLYRCLRVKHSLKVGIIEEKTYQIVSIERAIVEALHYASKMGLETALVAARRAFLQGLTTPMKVLQIAKELQLENAVIHNWEALVAT